jgi:putative acetyltransferase
MNITAETAADHQAVRNLHVLAFGEQGLKVADLVDSLRGQLDSSEGLSLVARTDREIIGHVMFTRSLLDAPPKLVDVQVLSPLAVTPAHQRQGVGASLVRRGLDLLAARSVPAVFLEGDPGYYSRFGFENAGEVGFRSPSLRIPPAGFQVCRLPAYEPWMTGTLVYSHVFWDHDLVGLRDG